MSHSPLKIVVPKLNQIERNVQQKISQHLKFIENFKNLNINDDTEESVSSGDYDRSPEKSIQRLIFFRTHFSTQLPHTTSAPNFSTQLQHTTICTAFLKR